MVLEYQNGNKAILEEICKKNKGIIRILANKFYLDSKIMDKEDLIQEGFIGLIKAVEKFDHNKGTQFTTYLARWVYSKMHRYVTNRSTENKEISLYTPTGEGTELQDLLQDTDNHIEEVDYKLDNRFLRIEIENVLHEALTLKQRELIHLKYGFDCKECSFQEIEEILQLRPNQANNIHKAAIYKIRNTTWGRKRIMHEVKQKRSELMQDYHSYDRIELAEYIENKLKQLQEGDKR